jgi:hypothetical protein
MIAETTMSGKELRAALDAALDGLEGDTRPVRRLAFGLNDELGAKDGHVADLGRQLAEARAAAAARHAEADGLRAAVESLQARLANAGRDDRREAGRLRDKVKTFERSFDIVDMAIKFYEKALTACPHQDYRARIGDGFPGRWWKFYCLSPKHVYGALVMMEWLGLLPDSVEVVPLPAGAFPWNAVPALPAVLLVVPGDALPWERLDTALQRYTGWEFLGSETDPFVADSFVLGAVPPLTPKVEVAAYRIAFEPEGETTP